MLIQMLGGVDLVVEQGFAATCVRSEGEDGCWNKTESDDCLDNSKEMNHSSKLNVWEGA